MLYSYEIYKGAWTVGVAYDMRLVRYDFGEPKNDPVWSYSLSLSQNGDTCKVEVENDIKEELKPGTIVYESLTSTWWVVDSDESVFEAHDGTKNRYIHTVTMSDAIEFLNGIDVSNHAYKADRYTNTTLLQRLFRVAKFKEKTSISYAGMTGLSTTTPNKFIAFDGFTLCSAIKEYARVMGFIAKLTFSTSTYNLSGSPLDGMTYIYSCTLNFINKAGLSNAPINITTLTHIYEQNKSEKSNFAVKVVSNMSNAQSSTLNRYPNYGGVPLMSENASEVDAETAIIKLPSNIQEVVSVGVYSKEALTILDEDKEVLQYVYDARYFFDDETRKEIVNANVFFYGHTQNIVDGLIALLPSVNSYVIASENDEDAFSQYENIPNYYRGISHVGTDNAIYLKQKPYRDTIISVRQKDRCMYWEQGSNKIQGFKWASAKTEVIFPTARGIIITDIPFSFNGVNYYFRLYRYANPTASDWNKGINDHLFYVNYYPQADVKIAYDSNKRGFFSKYYNQTGKIVDTYVASKLLTGYVDESSSSIKMKKMNYTSIASILPVGTVLYDASNYYIIGELSVDVFDGFYEVVYSLSTDRIARSENVSADGMIKDTKVPQMNNIKRTQLYRDYFEFSLSADLTRDTTLFLGTATSAIPKYFSFTEQGCGFNFDAVCYIKGVYKTPIVVGGVTETECYRAIDCTEYPICKGKLLVADFLDNNIIGLWRERVSS